MSVLEDAFRKLMDDLAAVGQDVAKNDWYDTAEGGRIERATAAYSLAYVNTFLRTMAVEDALLRPLTGLFKALADADEGISNSMLKPETMNLSRGRKTNAEIENKAELSAAVTFLLRAGRTLDQACRKATAGHDITPETLKTFRKNLLAGRSSDTTRVRYDEIIAIADASGRIDEEKALVIINRVRIRNRKKVY